ncbi:DUF1003 domain-containing protein [Cereibacter sp. SYSU M97828]|nr:DUF1003 domain-containing protein [Cereibacter flavus]
METEIQQLAQRLLQSDTAGLSPREGRVLKAIARRHSLTANSNDVIGNEATFGQRLADRVAGFGGSWTFIIAFAAVLAVWVAINTALLPLRDVFDPYPFVFLNLVLSMLAAIQAPVIMMSQNRQGMKDRTTANNDYEVNLKAELEIMHLHEKLDRQADQIAELCRVVQLRS